jgi:hypothetical protein
VRPADLNLADRAGRSGTAVIDVDDAHLHAVEWLAAAAPGRFGHVGVGAVAAVRAERLGHAEQPRSGSRPASDLGREERIQAARLQRRQIGAE